MRSPAAIPFDRLRGAPRHVAPSLVVRLCLRDLGLAASGVILFSCIFIAAFGLPALIKDVTLPSGPMTLVQARVTGNERTNLQVNKQHVVRVTFSFVDEGRPHEGVSYVTGPSMHASGDAVDVSLVDGHPDTAVIQGMRRTKSPQGLLLLLALPIAGVTLLLASVVRGLGRARLLRDGEPAKGRLVEQLPTGARVNKQPVVEYVFAFSTRQGVKTRTSVKTHQPAALLDDTDEPLFYDPADPSRAVLLGGLPGDPRVDDDGSFTAPASAFLLLMWPTLAVGALVLTFVASWG